MATVPTVRQFASDCDALGISVRSVGVRPPGSQISDPITFAYYSCARAGKTASVVLAGQPLPSWATGYGVVSSAAEVERMLR